MYSAETLFKEKNSVLIGLFNMLYLNLDACLFLIFATISKSPQLGYYSLINHDIMNYYLLCGIILLKNTDKKKSYIRFQVWRSIKNFLVISLLYLQILLERVLDQKWYSGIFLLPIFIVSCIIDWKNDIIQAKTYKLMGLVSEDEIIDIENIVRQKRRRFSISYLIANNYVDEDETEIQIHVNRWKRILSKRYELEPIFAKSATQSMSKFVKSVWRIIYAVRKVNFLKLKQRNRTFHNKISHEKYFSESDADCSPKCKDDLINIDEEKSLLNSDFVSDDNNKNVVGSMGESSQGPNNQVFKDSYNEPTSPKKKLSRKNTREIFNNDKQDFNNMNENIKNKTKFLDSLTPIKNSANVSKLVKSSSAVFELFEDRNEFQKENQIFGYKNYENNLAASSKKFEIDEDFDLNHGNEIDV